MYSDEYIEFCGNVFVKYGIYSFGIRFEQYLSEPAFYAHLLDEYLPLLPKQEQVKQRLASIERALSCKACARKEKEACL